MSVKVSVVVPVYNAGTYIDACAGSLLNQSMAPEDYEVIFVDDGSTDGTAERLAATTAGHDHVRVVRIRNTGGPGGPRNLGLDAARGEYTYFLDCDDWLGPEALERMYAMAARNGSDVLIGRMVGQGRSVSRALFQESRDRADILKHHLLGLLTPHKLFRTAFLRKHEIRFPEGPVRLEDHRFCMPAYFKAEGISVLADYPCCYWVKRKDKGNYSSRRFDPVHYYSAVRKVLDTVDEHVEPGLVRDRFYAHWLRGKMLRRMGGGTFMSYPEDYRRELFNAVRDLLLERFPLSVERHIPRCYRPRAALVRAGAYDDLVALAEAEQGITVRPALESSTTSGKTVVLTLSAAFVYRDGTPVTFHREGPRTLWKPPAALCTPLPAETLDVTDTLPKAKIQLVARHRETSLEVPVPTTFTMANPTGTVRLTGEARLNAEMPPGPWDLRVRLDACGWGVERRIPGVRLHALPNGKVQLQRHTNAPRRFPALRRAARRVPGLRHVLRLIRRRRVRR